MARRRGEQVQAVVCRWVPQVAWSAKTWAERWAQEHPGRAAPSCGHEHPDLPPTARGMTTRVRASTGLVLTLAVDRQRLSSIAHSHHPIAAPIFGVNLNRLLRRAGRQPAARVLDLGCGEGSWALQALAHYPDGHADGVDVSRYALERAAGAAAERGLADRLTLHERDARTYVPDGD